MFEWIGLHSTHWEIMLPVALAFGFTAAWLASRRHDALIAWLSLAACVSSWLLIYTTTGLHGSLSLDRAWWGAVAVTLWIGVFVHVSICVGAWVLSGTAKARWSVRGMFAALAGVGAIPAVNLVTEHLYWPLYTLFSQMTGQS